MAVVVALALGGCTTSGQPRSGTPAAAVSQTVRMRPHYAANSNFGPDGTFLPGALRFTLADVSSVDDLMAAPVAARAFVYLGACTGATAGFRATVGRYASSQAVWGFYLADDPDPATCPPARLKSETTWIHHLMPNAHTFILLQNASSSRHPVFRGYTPGNTGVDLFGLDPYPCRTELSGCDFSMIDRYVAAALRAGFPRETLVPVYQTFGGGTWVDDGGGRYAMPSAGQARTMICRWEFLLPKPAFDFAYSWGSQRGDAALATAPRALRDVLAMHNRGALDC